MAINRNNSLNRGFIGVDKRIGNEGIFRPRSEYLDAMNFGRFVEYDFTTGSYYTKVNIDRMSLGVYTDSTGIIRSNSNALRIEYGRTSGITLGLLVERQSKNYTMSIYNSGHSETFHIYGGPWIFFNPTWTRGWTSTQSATGGWSIINFSGACAPDGYPSAELYVPGINGMKMCYHGNPFLTAPAGFTHAVYSIFAKVYGVTAEGGTAPTRLQIGDAANNSFNVRYNIISGTIISQAGVSSAFIENYGNGWWRCSYSRLTPGSVVPNIGPYPSSNEPPNPYGPVYAGYTASTEGQTGMLLWGFQSELGTYYPTSYIRTGFYDPIGEIFALPGYGVNHAGAVSTRNEDRVYISDVSWLQSPGTFFVEYYRRDGISTGINIPNNTLIATDNISGRFICVDHVPSGTTAALRWSNGSISAAGGVTGLNRVAFSVNGISGSSSSVQIVLNGGTASGVTSSNFNIDEVQWITIGSRSTQLTSGYSNFYDGIIRKIRFYPRLLSAQEMRDLTRV